ncbi:MAG TPA: DUF1697 domain-containing protein [Bacilli bacterium]|nr:DUF1697 domain-containing protein [Bacilli bacterium]
MTTYVALLRGINVGGKHLIKMADLREWLESLGLSNVQTYIQSGNVLFDSEEAADVLQDRLEREMENRYGFPVPVMLRTAAEYRRVLEECPFPLEGLSEEESVHVSFLAQEPTEEELGKLPKQPFGTDEYRVVGRELYLLLRQRVSDSKLPILLQKACTGTMRNWKTVTKIREMVEKREG